MRFLLLLIFLFDSILVTHQLFAAKAPASDTLQEAIHQMGPDYFNATIRVMKAFREKTRTADAPPACNGRLTLTSATPVTTSNVTAATAVYFTPFQGNQITLYNDSSTRWQLVTFTETSVSVPATTSTPFDIFAYNNSGTLALTTVNWTNGTTRATSLTTQNGIPVSSSDSKYRYLGTAMTTGVSGQTVDSTAQRYLWNMCNRVPRKLLAQSTTDSWAYTTATWRAANGSSTNGVTEVEFVLGQQIEPVKLEVFVPEISNSGGVNPAAAGIGIDSTSANSADVYGFSPGTNNITTYSKYTGYPAVGFHYGQWLEISVASSTTTWYTDAQSGGSQRQGGILGEIWD